MFRVNGRRSRSVLELMLTGLFVVALVAGAAIPAAAQPLATTKTTRAAYHDQWRKLWEDHITWTRVVILGILDGLPGNGAYVNRLLQNPGDMAAALQPYYGDQAQVFGDLVTQHLVIAAELLTAAHNGDSAGVANFKTQWYANAHDLAVQMHKMNPEFWPEAMTEQMWVDHLNLTLEEATDNLTGDYAGEVTAYDQVHDMALQMADFISKGVIQQFPGRFQGR